MQGNSQWQTANSTTRNTSN